MSNSKVFDAATILASFDGAMTAYGAVAEMIRSNIKTKAGKAAIEQAATTKATDVDGKRQLSQRTEQGKQFGAFKSCFISALKGTQHEGLTLKANPDSDSKVSILPSTPKAGNKAGKSKGNATLDDSKPSNVEKPIEAARQTLESMDPEAARDTALQLAIRTYLVTGSTIDDMIVELQKAADLLDMPSAEKPKVSAKAQTTAAKRKAAAAAKRKATIAAKKAAKEGLPGEQREVA